ncbi:5' exonuclease Apollo-like isoform X3 [Cherax quadricarinatus]|uniref:5' exonuclease Apollo-like isoform X3 n=1 Tax=Cherax quadricarinatus TaxID=27406 RepID=UPI00387E8458
MNGCVINGTPVAVDFWKPTKAPQLPKSIIRELEVGETYLIPLDNEGNYPISVTVLDANHVPGAVMFLFQGYFGNILYCGDMRWYPELVRHKVLRSVVEERELDVLYLDNTFSAPYCVFPTREEAKQELFRIIDSYPDHVIKLTVRDLGREDLLESVARRFHERILVGQGKYELLRLLRYSDAFTTNPEEARIHAVPLHQFQVSAHKKWSQEQPTISIVLTAEYVGWSNGPYSSQHENGIFIVPYSDHSSYPELLEMVAQLAPRQVVPIVQQKSPKGWWADSNAPDQAVKTDMTVYDNFLTFPPPEPVIVPEAIVDLMRKGGPFSLTHQPRRCGLHRAFTPRPRRTMGVVFTSPDRSFSSPSQHTVSPAPSSVSTLDVSIPDTYTAYHSDFSPVAKSSPDLKLLHSVNGKQLDIQNLNEEVPKNSKLEDKPSQSRVLPAPQSSLQVSNATFKQCSFNSDNGMPSKKQKISEVSHDPKPNGDLLSTFSPVTKSRNTEISSLSSSRETPEEALSRERKVWVKQAVSLMSAQCDRLSNKETAENYDFSTLADDTWAVYRSLNYLLGLM